jgi:hypothetical protein
VHKRYRRPIIDHPEESPHSQNNVFNNEDPSLWFIQLITDILRVVDLLGAVTSQHIGHSRW